MEIRDLPRRILEGWSLDRATKGVLVLGLVLLVTSDQPVAKAASVELPTSLPPIVLHRPEEPVQLARGVETKLFPTGEEVYTMLTSPTAVPGSSGVAWGIDGVADGTGISVVGTLGFPPKPYFEVVVDGKRVLKEAPNEESIRIPDKPLPWWKSQEGEIPPDSPIYTTIWDANRGIAKINEEFKQNDIPVVLKSYSRSNVVLSLEQENLHTYNDGVVHLFGGGFLPYVYKPNGECWSDANGCYYDVKFQPSALKVKEYQVVLHEAGHGGHIENWERFASHYYQTDENGKPENDLTRLLEIWTQWMSIEGLKVYLGDPDLEIPLRRWTENINPMTKIIAALDCTGVKGKETVLRLGAVGDMESLKKVFESVTNPGELTKLLDEGPDYFVPHKCGLANLHQELLTASP